MRFKRSEFIYLPGAFAARDPDPDMSHMCNLVRNGPDDVAAKQLLRGPVARLPRCLREATRPQSLHDRLQQKKPRKPFASMNQELWANSEDTQVEILNRLESYEEAR